MDGERTYMKFEKVVIKNFRNFDNVELDLSNKNIFFGLNDVGKTNFLYALRYVFDKDIRKQNLLEAMKRQADPQKKMRRHWRLIYQKGVLMRN